MTSILEVAVIISDGTRVWVSVHTDPVEAVRWLREGLPRHAEQVGVSVDAMHAHVHTARGERPVEVYGQNGPNRAGIVWDRTAGNTVTTWKITTRRWLAEPHAWDAQ